MHSTATRSYEPKPFSASDRYVSALMSREGSATVDRTIGALRESYGQFPVGEERTVVARPDYLDCVRIAGEDRLGGARALIRRDGRVLLARRADSPTTWGLPGGSLGRFETHEQAAKRHVADQVDVEFEVTAVLHARRYTFSLVDGGGGPDGLWVCFEGRSATADVEAGGDVLEVRWFDDPPSDVSPAVHDRLGIATD